MVEAEQKLRAIIEAVAQALGNDLLREVAFVGGCTVGLFITDEVTMEGIRFTDDVDLIFNVISYKDWNTFQSQLQDRGFRTDSNNEFICRMRLGDLKVDFMPDDKNILGFSSRWYKSATKPIYQRFHPANACTADQALCHSMHCTVTARLYTESTPIVQLSQLCAKI